MAIGAGIRYQSTLWGQTAVPVSLWGQTTGLTVRVVRTENGTAVFPKTVKAGLKPAECYKTTKNHVALTAFSTSGGRQKRKHSEISSYVCL